MSTKCLQQAYQQEDQQFKSLWSLLEKWAKLEEQFGQSLQSLVGKYATMRTNGSPFGDLVEHLREKAQSSVGFSEWLRLQVLKRYKGEVEALGSFNWATLNQDSKEDRARLAQLEAVERNVQLVEDQVKSSYEKLERAKLTLSSNIPRLQVEFTSLQMKLQDGRLHLTHLKKLYAASHSTFLDGPVQCLKMHEAGRMAISKQAMLEIIATSEEKSVWENGHLDTWKNKLFKIDPHQLADDMILNALFTEAPPAYDSLTPDPLANIDSFNSKEQEALVRLLSMFEIDNTLADADTVERIRTQLRRRPSENAVVPDLANHGHDDEEYQGEGGLEGCCTWDVDSEDDEIHITALQP